MHALGEIPAASRRSVDEISSSILMQAVYRTVGQGRGRVEALRAAQRTVRITTVGEVLAYCEGAMAQLHDGDEVGRLALRWDIAELHHRARDVPRALAAYEALLADVDPRDRNRRRLFVAAARCRRAAAASMTPVDYGLPAFDHPYHWAAFQVVGDWR